MTAVPTGPPSDSKLKQAAEAVGDVILSVVVDAAFDGAAKLAGGTVDAVSAAAEAAAELGSAALDAAGAALDGL